MPRLVLLDDSGSRQKVAGLLSALQAVIKAEILPNVAQSLQASVDKNTPTPDQEYETLMLGDGPRADGVSLIPRSGNRSGDSDGRIRFEKVDGTWLKDINMSPRNLFVDTSNNFVSIGETRFLETSTKFFFTNKNGKQYIRGPYIYAFESGSLGAKANIEPLGGAAHGGKYPLRPDEEDRGPKKGLPHIFQMYKPITPRWMYEPLRLMGVARSIIINLLRTVKTP